MKITALPIEGLLLIEPKRLFDERGFFSETFRVDALMKAAGPLHFVQENHAFSSIAGTIRGLHQQLSPMEQGKLVRVTRGSIYDVAVDVRPHSPTYRHYYSVILSETNFLQLYIPPGFLHGYCTLEDKCDIQYKVTNYYDPMHERSVRFNDPTISIKWPAIARTDLMSEKDMNAPCL